MAWYLVKPRVNFTFTLSSYKREKSGNPYGHIDGIHEFKFIVIVLQVCLAVGVKPLTLLVPVFRSNLF